MKGNGAKRNPSEAKICNFPFWSEAENFCLNIFCRRRRRLRRMSWKSAACKSERSLSNFPKAYLPNLLEANDTLQPPRSPFLEHMDTHTHALARSSTLSHTWVNTFTLSLSHSLSHFSSLLYSISIRLSSSAFSNPFSFIQTFHLE